jgi:hypothetical protein
MASSEPENKQQTHDSDKQLWESLRRNVVWKDL